MCMRNFYGSLIFADPSPRRRSPITSTGKRRQVDRNCGPRDPRGATVRGGRAGGGTVLADAGGTSLSSGNGD